MTLARFQYDVPDFAGAPLADAPDARCAPAPADALLPDDFFIQHQAADVWRPVGVRALTTVCVDQTEFVVNQLRDRGTHQAFGVVTNARDFMHVLRFYVERWEQAQTSASSAPR